MSAIYLDNRLVHYEVFGRGKPIIFLHSWLGSWRYWVPTMELVAERYRAYALDFWGFGESEQQPEMCTIPEYKKMLIAFMDEIGLRQAFLVGHGMGGMVAVLAAQHAPERFSRLITVSTPIDGQILRDVVKPGTFSRLLGRSTPSNVWSKLIRQIPVDDEDVQQELYEDTDNLQEAVVKKVQESILGTNLKPVLTTLESPPLLVVYGEKDTIVPPEHAEFLDENQELPQRLILPRTNHFPFLDNVSTFGRLVFDFEVSEGSDVEIKEQWRRRVSQREYL